MESHAQGVEDNLIASLSFKLRPGASYVTDRRSVSFFPQGGNDYSPAGVQVKKDDAYRRFVDGPRHRQVVYDYQTYQHRRHHTTSCRSLGYVSPSAYFVRWSDCGRHRSLWTMDAYMNNFTR